MAKPEARQATPGGQKLVRTVFVGGALVFLAAGVVIAAAPQLLEAWLGLDRFTARMLGGALVLVGVTDLVLSRFIFKARDGRARRSSVVRPGRDG